MLPTFMPIAMNSKNWLYLIASTLVLVAFEANAQEADSEPEASAEEAEESEVTADEDATTDEEADGEGDEDDEEELELEPTHEAHYTVFVGGGYSLMHGDLAGTGAANLLVGANFGIELTERFAVTAGAGYMSRFGGELVDETDSAPISSELGTRHLLSFELGVRGRLGGSPETALRLGGGFMGLVEFSSAKTGFSRTDDSGEAFYQEFSPAVYLDLAYPVAVLDAGSVLVGLRVVQELAPTVEATGDVDGRVFIEPGDGPTGQAWYTGLNLTVGWEF